MVALNYSQALVAQLLCAPRRCLRNGLASVRIPTIARLFTGQALPLILAIKGAIIVAINRDQRRLILGLPQDYPVSRADPASAPRIICSPRDAHRYWAR